MAVMPTVAEKEILLFGKDLAYRVDLKKQTL